MARLACRLEDGKSIDCGGISGSGFSVSKDTRKETTNGRAGRVQKVPPVRQEMRLRLECGVGCGRALKGYGGQRTPGPQMCDAALCPPLPIMVVELCP